MEALPLRSGNWTRPDARIPSWLLSLTEPTRAIPLTGAGLAGPTWPRTPVPEEDHPRTATPVPVEPSTADPLADVAVRAVPVEVAVAEKPKPVSVWA